MVNVPAPVPCSEAHGAVMNEQESRLLGWFEVESRLDAYASSGHRARAILSAALDQGFGVGVPGFIAQECSSLRDMLLAKNAAYGNSALDPIRIMSKADPVEQILVRIDDKLSRLARGSAAGEDVELDLLGYLVLLRVARRLRPKEEP